MTGLIIFRIRSSYGKYFTILLILSNLLPLGLMERLGRFSQTNLLIAILRSIILCSQFNG